LEAGTVRHERLSRIAKILGRRSAEQSVDPWLRGKTPEGPRRTLGVTDSAGARREWPQAFADAIERDFRLIGPAAGLHGGELGVTVAVDAWTPDRALGEAYDALERSLAAIGHDAPAIARVVREADAERAACYLGRWV
jgi:hypothetical protein